MLKTLLKHPTLPAFLSGGILGAVAGLRYKNRKPKEGSEVVLLSASRLQELGNELKKARNDYHDITEEYFKFFGMNLGRPAYYQYMCESELPEVIALEKLLPYARQELLRLEKSENFGEAEANEYILTIATLRKTFDKAVEAAKKAAEENEKNKLDK